MIFSAQRTRPAADGEEARPRYQRKARHALTGETSLTPTARECIFAMTALALSLALTWGISAMYQQGYADGYQDAREACDA